MSLAAPPSRPTPVDLERLSTAQLTGAACIWCGSDVTFHGRREVGTIGRPSTTLYGCRECVDLRLRRLPVWPEPGSA